MKKKVLLMILTIISSLLLFTNKADAIVMWMQCTEEKTGEMPTNNDGFKNYNSFAVVNNKNGGGLRHIVYNPNQFYGGYNPVYILYDDDNGQDLGALCWYNEWYDDYEGPLSECDKPDDRVVFSELLNGVCPVGVDQTTGTNTSGGTKGDFLVLYGKQEAKYLKELNESKLIIYKFKKKDEGHTELMVESYQQNGIYSYATTWEDWDTFAEYLNMNYSTDIDDLINGDRFDDEFITWTAASQARRVATCGSDYFDLLMEPDPNTGRTCSLLVGARSNQQFEITEVLYRSDDKNGNFADWTKEWSDKYKTEIQTQLDILDAFEPGGNSNGDNYSKLLEVAREISDAVDEGKKYTFDDNDYSAVKMVEDLKIAYDNLKIIIKDTDITYISYDKNCNIDDKKTHDPLAAALSEFNCGEFDVSEMQYLKHKYNPTLIDNLLLEIFSSKINALFQSDSGIENVKKKGEEYVKLFAKASAYIKKNVFFSDESVTILITQITDDYLELTNEFGVEIVVDCETLIGQDLIDEINKYLDIVKIAIPIILIGLGVIDFTKAIFAGDDSKMKKAQQDFIKRIAIAILIFLTPTIINLLLSLANKVWNFIEPSSCGLF